MADVKMNEFLLQYYMQKHFNAMPEEQFAQYAEYLRANDFRKNMKSWRDKGLVVQGPNGNWIKNRNYPDPNDAAGNFHLTDDEWRKFFNTFQNAFRAMDANKNSFINENSDAKNFLNEWFGANKLFSQFTISPAITTQIDGFYNNILNGPHANAIYQWIGNLFNNRQEYSEFLTNIQSHKYNTDTEVRDKLNSVVRTLFQYRQQGYFDQEPNLRQALDNAHLENIASGFDDAGIVSQQKLDFFKRNYRSLLDTLYSKKKVYDVFNQYGSKITSNIDKAKDKVDYEEGRDSYIPPKRDDELTPWQQLSKHVSDSWTEYMDKYIKMHGDRLFFSDSAKLIFKALTGAKFKPTDGLDKLLQSSGDIKKNLLYKSPRATDHFDWMVKTLNELKTTMPKAFEGALRNGRQMRAIIAELILKAVRENKIDEAKTAMEVLSVIKYGYTTSKIMDALGKEELKIFSDGGLSWNKNQGMQFVTKALDRSIKWAFMGLGYGITFVGNAIKLNGSKFNGRAGDRITAQRNQMLADNAQGRADIVNRHAQDRADLANANTELTNLNTGRRPINAGNIDRRRNDLNRARTTEQAHLNNIDTLNQERQAAQQRIATHRQTASNLAARRRAARQAGTQLNNRLAQLQGYLANPAVAVPPFPAVTTTMTPAAVNAIMQSVTDEMTNLQNQITANNQQLADIANEVTALRNQHTTDVDNMLPSRRNPNGFDARIAHEQQLYNRSHRANDQTEQRIQSYDNATMAVNELNAAIANHATELQNWDDNHQDKYRELMAYWDMLETGRDSHMGKMYSWTPGKAKNKQAAFAGRRDRIIQDYLSSYRVA